METIKIKLLYKSQYKNGWPLIRVTLNDRQIGAFEANSDTWSVEITEMLLPKNSLKIWHFGKNYLEDHSPDKFFEIEKIWINDVDLKHHIHLFRQTAFLPPWDDQAPPEHSLYLGHEGYLELKFDRSLNTWIRKIFGIKDDTIHGQKSTRECLQTIKDYFFPLNP